jgi:hypothetical protein
MTNSYDLWQAPPNWKKIAFNVPAEVAVHWINKTVTDKGREHVREHVKMIHWGKGEGDDNCGTRFEGHELLDFADACKLYGMPS